MRRSRDCFGGSLSLLGAARWRRPRPFATPGVTSISSPWKGCLLWSTRIWFSRWTGRNRAAFHHARNNSRICSGTLGGERRRLFGATRARSLLPGVSGGREPGTERADRSRWLTQCDAEIDNFRAALDWLFQTVDLDWSVRLCVALFRFWDMREHLSEGRARIETVLRLCGEERTRDRARLSHFLGALASAQGDYRAAEISAKKPLSL